MYFLYSAYNENLSLLGFVLFIQGIPQVSRYPPQRLH